VDCKRWAMQTPRRRKIQILNVFLRNEHKILPSAVVSFDVKIYKM
jgi:hypothetical protein